MKTFWRISKHVDLSGQGGRLSSARWHIRGKLVVYLADCPASALLEQIVHLQAGSGKLPEHYDLLRVTAPDSLGVRELLPLASIGWKEEIGSTQRIGYTWLISLETPLARVPSAIVPHTWNYLLNPAHPDAKGVQVAEVIREHFDNRLFSFGTV